jgi:hypothetical protein
MGGHHGKKGLYFIGSSSSSPISLYLDLIRDMHREKYKEHTSLIPLIHVYEGKK